MLLLEKVRDFLTPERNKLEQIKDLPVDKVQRDLSAEEFSSTDWMAFFDNNAGGLYFDNIQRVSTQATKIDLYRQTAKIDNVAIGLGILTDEITYTEEFKKPLQLVCEFDNEKISESVQESFDKIMKLMSIDKNLYLLVYNTYIDGQMNVYLDYDKSGISKIVLLDPRFLSFNIKDNIYKYLDIQGSNSLFYSRTLDPSKVKEYQPEQIVNADFGVVSDDGIVLSEIEKIIKTANQLKTLEDLLIPLRFSRSISRRVFNVDVSDLPNSKAEAYMREVAKKFKYRKEYNTQTGEIKNQQHITSMVEDYWISSRGGQKGITVDLLDEQGNLGQLEDIKLFQRKLFQGMGIPENRLTDEQGQSASVFDISADQISSEDVKFFMKIRRIRNVYTEFIKRILKRELIYTKKFTEEQYEELKDAITIRFSSENQFMERMRISLFMRKLESWGNAREYAGKLFPVRSLYKTIFGMEEEEVNATLKELQKESEDPLLAGFYKSPDEEME